MNRTVRIPFTVGHIAGMTLAEQIAEGVRNAISTGFYKPGEILPTRRQFAETLRVSERAPREAMALLADEGLVSARRCLGCVISEKSERRWRGRVLFVESGDFLSYFHTAFRASFAAGSSRPAIW